MLELVLFGGALALVGVGWLRLRERLCWAVWRRWERWLGPLQLAGAGVAALGWWGGVLVLELLPAGAGVWAAWWPLVAMMPTTLGLYRWIRWHLVDAERVAWALPILTAAGYRVTRCAVTGVYDLDPAAPGLPAVTTGQRPAGLVRLAQAVQGRAVATAVPVGPTEAELARAVAILRSIGCQVTYQPAFGWYEVDHREYTIPAVEGIQRPAELVQVAAVVRTAEIWRQLQPVLVREVVYLDRDEPEPAKGAW